MEVTIKIVLENFNDGDFDTNNDYYKSNDDFFDAVKRNVDMNSNVAYEVMSNQGSSMGRRTASFGTDGYKPSKNARNSIYTCKATLLDEDENDETVDSLVTKSLTDDVVVSIIQYNTDSMDEEFEEDLKLWISDHHSINQYKDKLGDDAVWENEPKRTFIVSFPNKSGEEVNVQYENCRIVSEFEGVKYAVLAENVKLVEFKG